LVDDLRISSSRKVVTIPVQFARDTDYQLTVYHATLDAAKTADGLMALKWFKEGRMDLIEEYCQKDVELTRDLFYYGLKKNFLLFDRKNEERMRIPLDWKLEDLVKED
jgi:hypothetical protein